MNYSKSLFLLFFLSINFLVYGQKKYSHYVNPFIGSSNFGTTNPGANLPHGLMNITPFNVMGSELNSFDKDKRWWSAPYTSDNKFCTGFSHVNLSGVGCPDLGSILLMPTAGELEVDYHKYGSIMSKEKARPGYYSTYLDNHGIKAEVTATMRTALSAFTYSKGGKANILLNLGEGLTNESGATVKFINDSTITGSKLMGTFCYNPQAVFRQYFAMRIDRKALDRGYWKKQRPMEGVEAEWDQDHGKYKVYRGYTKDMSGDDIGVWFSFDVKPGETLYVQTAVSFVSEENALKNLHEEQQTEHVDRPFFTQLVEKAEKRWDETLGIIEVEGGTDEEKTIFYTALYHLLIHPNILNDVNGEYPQMESLKTGKRNHDRYTVYSLWDTYRNVHPLLCIIYPKRQLDMVNTMLDMYRESGWLPKWELYGRETLTMEGDPSISVINDTYQRGLRDFDTALAYEAMKKGADTPGKENKMRPDNDDYLSLGYVPIRGKYDNSVSHALEYYIADWNLSCFASALGHKKDAKKYLAQSLRYKKYYDKEFGTLRPVLPDGKFLTPFNPLDGQNFEPCPGFHEGTAWNYTFFVPHDIKGLTKLMGGKKKFVQKLQLVFDKGYYDPANEPDIAYPYLFTYFPDEAWRTQKITRELLKQHFHNAPTGIPGNDDTGTMSAWAIFTMMGFYPDCPGNTEYALTLPVFSKITIHLDKKYYANDKLVITVDPKLRESGKYFNGYKISSTGKVYNNTYRIDHSLLMNAKELIFF